MQNVSIAQLSSIFTFYGFSEAWPLRVGRAFLPVGIPVRSLPETPAKPGRACRRSAAERCGALERLVSEANSLSLPPCRHPRSLAPGDSGATWASVPAKRSGAVRRARKTRERSERILSAWLPVQVIRLPLGMVFLPFQEIRIPGMDVAFIYCGDAASRLPDSRSRHDLSIHPPPLRHGGPRAVRSARAVRRAARQGPRSPANAGGGAYGQSPERLRKKAIAARQSARAICPRNAFGSFLQAGRRRSEAEPPSGLPSAPRRLAGWLFRTAKHRPGARACGRGLSTGAQRRSSK